MEEYARCILFDYSYRYFYGDGYGKDYRILNLEDDEDNDVRRLYLDAALLTFYQQLRLHADCRSTFRPFLLERPLWIFVGGSVTKSTSSKDITDIEDILLFLARFVADRAGSVRQIDRIVNGKSGLHNKSGFELFPVTFFEHVTSLAMSSENVYDDVLRVIFNASGPGKLHVEQLKGAEGEIALRVGDNEPFGVVNVSSVKQLCCYGARSTRPLASRYSRRFPFPFPSMPKGGKGKRRRAGEGSPRPGGLRRADPYRNPRCRGRNGRLVTCSVDGPVAIPWKMSDGTTLKERD